MDSADLPTPASHPETLARPARYARVAVTLAGLLLLLVGTLWGSDDHFPFGPFRMYAGVNAPDDDAPDTRVEAVDISGATLVLTERNTGVRRAEVEGQEAAFVAEPRHLETIAAAYERRNPGAPPLVRVSLVVRWHDIEDGRVTGAWRDEVKAIWERPS